jgi:hypothetical protein
MSFSLRALLVVVCGLLACGGKPVTTVDAGIDTSCGLDCAAQGTYGLLVNRCFEYSSDSVMGHNPPALGAWVKPLRTLEGGVKVLPVEYRIGGQLRMTDNFSIINGELYLMRREFNGAGSITYKTGAAITGVKWLVPGAGKGENYDTDVDGFVVGSSGSGATTGTSFRMTTAAGATSELRTPFQTFTDGLKLLPGETPDHGADTRRIFVPQVGFVVISSALSPTPGQALPYFVQRVRDPGTPDGGAEDCSLGAP